MLTKSNTTAVPLWGLLIIGTAYGVYNTVVAAYGLYSGTFGGLLWSLCWFVFVSWWIRADARIRKVDLPFDYGILLYVFAPFFLFWYLWTTRRVPGLFLAICFLAWAIIPSFVGDFVWLLIGSGGN